MSERRCVRCGTDLGKNTCTLCAVSQACCFCKLEAASEGAVVNADPDCAYPATNKTTILPQLPPYGKDDLWN